MPERCPRCAARGKTWQGDPPACAFPEQAFTRDNWNCATMNALREMAEELDPAYSEDQYAAIIPSSDGCFLVIGWYKRRGKTEVALIIDGDSTRPLTLDNAEHFLAGREEA